MSLLKETLTVLLASHERKGLLKLSVGQKRPQSSATPPYCQLCIEVVFGSSSDVVACC